MAVSLDVGPRGMMLNIRGAMRSEMGGGQTPNEDANSSPFDGNGILSFHPTVQARYGWIISGTTRDSTGVALGLCTVDVFRTIDDVRVVTVTSDVNGAFSVQTPDWGQYYLVAYLAGSPDVAGTSVNTLVASIT